MLYLRSPPASPSSHPPSPLPFSSVVIRAKTCYNAVLSSITHCIWKRLAWPKCRISTSPFCILRWVKLCKWILGEIRERIAAFLNPSIKRNCNGCESTSASVQGRSDGCNMRSPLSIIWISNSLIINYKLIYYNAFMLMLDVVFDCELIIQLDSWF